MAFTSKQTSYLHLGDYEGLNSLMRSLNVILFHLELLKTIETKFQCWTLLTLCLFS